MLHSIGAFARTHVLDLSDTHAPALPEHDGAPADPALESIPNAGGVMTRGAPGHSAPGLPADLGGDRGGGYVPGSFGGAPSGARGDAGKGVDLPTGIGGPRSPDGLDLGAIGGMPGSGPPPVATGKIKGSDAEAGWEKTVCQVGWAMAGAAIGARLGGVPGAVIGGGLGALGSSSCDRLDGPGGGLATKEPEAAPKPEHAPDATEGVEAAEENQSKKPEGPKEDQCAASNAPPPCAPPPEPEKPKPDQMPNPEGPGGGSPTSNVFRPSDEGGGVGPRLDASMPNPEAAGGGTPRSNVFRPSDEGGAVGPRLNALSIGGMLAVRM